MTLAVVACSPTAADTAGSRDPEQRTGPAAPSSPAGGGPAAAREDTVVAALRDELLAMRRADQAERTGDPALPPGTRLPPPQDYARTVRLKEMIAAHGWPTSDLVGEDASTGAWLVAQHADFDVEFQQQVADFMRSAVAARQADPTELAYLQDRVAVNRGRPQRYGSQVRCSAGVPAPATPLVDPSAVDAFRAEVGLGTLEEYYGELAMMCADEAAEGAQPEP